MMKESSENQSFSMILSTGYIVVKEEFEDEPLELELEEDGNLRMSTLISQFSGACGLRFRNVATGAMRGVRLHNDLFLPPNGAEGWPTDVVFNVVYSKNPDKSAKKAENGHQQMSVPRRSGNKPSDLAVLSIPWQTTAEDLKMYFSRFGKVVFSDIKVDAETGKSRGFGFIRFEHYESQLAAMECPIHELDGRQIVLRLTKKGETGNQLRKVFVGRLTTDLNRHDLQEYFSQFGQITEITIPQPFRSFAFITFADSNDAIAILDQDHLIKGTSVVTRSADPIQDDRNRRTNQNTNGNGLPNQARFQNSRTFSNNSAETSVDPMLMKQVQQALNQVIQPSAAQDEVQPRVRFSEQPPSTRQVQDDPFSGVYRTRPSSNSPTNSSFQIDSGLISRSIQQQMQPPMSRGRPNRLQRASPPSWNNRNPWDNAPDPQRQNYFSPGSWL